MLDIYTKHELEQQAEKFVADTIAPFGEGALDAKQVRDRVRWLLEDTYEQAQRDMLV